MFLLFAVIQGLPGKVKRFDGVSLSGGKAKQSITGIVMNVLRVPNALFSSSKNLPH